MYDFVYCSGFEIAQWNCGMDSLVEHQRICLGIKGKDLQRNRVSIEEVYTGYRYLFFNRRDETRQETTDSAMVLTGGITGGVEIYSRRSTILAVACMAETGDYSPA